MRKKDRPERSLAPQRSPCTLIARSGGSGTRCSTCSRTRGARRNRRVARYASPDEEVRYGTRQLDAVLGDLGVRSRALRGRLAVDVEKPRIPIPRRQGTVRLGIEGPPSKRSSPPRAPRGQRAQEDLAIVTTVTTELESATLRTISVRPSAGNLSLGEIPLTARPALASSLARVKLPDGTGYDRGRSVGRI